MLPDFLRSKCTPRDDKGSFVKEHHVPVFYGIPKIHKQPVKVRPIIPCHSAIQNPTAKVVSKILQPIVNNTPSIIHGTKDLAIRLSQVNLSPVRKWWLVTGDVVAFYPNIDLDLCIDICVSMVANHLFPNLHGDALYATLSRQGLPEAEMIHCGVTPEDMSFLIWFDTAIKTASKNLCCVYNGEYFKQLLGLAMGVACSPDMANLYGAYFEKLVAVLSDPRIPFYGRYIDDCFAVVYAESAEEALMIVGRIKFDNCTIEWEVSYWACPFLDMLLWKDAHNRLQWSPYRKARNHLERVPWISAHPLSVKRAVFIGELSRMAVLCSRREDYLKAVKEVSLIYMRRGYPEACIKRWNRENINKRWADKYVVRDKGKSTGGLLILKSEFNEAWDMFNTKECEKTMINYWRGWLEAADKGVYDNHVLSHGYGPPNSTHVGFGALEELSTEYTRINRGVLQRFRVPDLRKLGIITESGNWQLLVSKKRTKNLYDCVQTWKKIVISGIDEQILSNHSDSGDEIVLDQRANDERHFPTIHHAERPVPGDLEHVHYSI